LADVSLLQFVSFLFNAIFTIRSCKNFQDQQLYMAFWPNFW
jgi:hypothetical protein